MTHETRLTQLMEELLNYFEFDPTLKIYTMETLDGPVTIPEALEELIDRANDLIYGDDADEYTDGIGYATEEEEG